MTLLDGTLLGFLSLGLPLLLLLHLAFLDHLAEHRDARFYLLLLVGQILDLILHLLDLGAGLVELIRIVSLHQFVFVLVTRTVQPSHGEAVHAFVHLTAERNVDELLAHDVDVAKKAHVLTLDPRVVVQMRTLALFERLAHMANVLLHGVAHLIVLLVQVCLPDLVLVGLVEHVDSMQSLNPLLELLVVVDVVLQHLVHFVLELLLVLVLFADLGDRCGLLLLHTLTLQLHILDDQKKVAVNDLEMFLLIVHLGLLFLKSLEDLHARSHS